MKSFTDQFKHKTILVIGDLMLDEYIFGNITRMSPEAPTTPVILAKSEKLVLGGAANVAHNIVSLGGDAILVGSLGNDKHGEMFTELLRKTRIRNMTLATNERPTIIKTRIFDGERQVARVDYERAVSLSKKELDIFAKCLNELPRRIDFVVISDYAKGMFTKETMQLILRKFSGDRVIADIKPVHKNLVRDICLITPNLKEVSVMAGTKLRRHEDIRKITKGLTRKLRTSVLATMGREGMMLCDKNDLSIYRAAPPKIRALDVTGAGDVATAACALALASGAPLREAVGFANHAAAISVTKLGTATVTAEEAGKWRMP